MEQHTRLTSVLARRDVRILAVVVAVEVLLLGLYVLATPGQLTRPRYAIYPFVWINAGLWAVMHTDPPSAPRRRQVTAGLVAVVYLFVLLWLTGLVGIDLAGNPDEMVGVTVGYGSPGWERISVVLPAAHLTLIPFRLVGYLALAYLVYVTLLDATTVALGGALGLVSCVSCTFPILVSLASAVFGSSAAVVGTLFTYSADVSTAVFLLAVALLYYRPGFEKASAG